MKPLLVNERTTTLTEMDSLPRPSLLSPGNEPPEQNRGAEDHESAQWQTGLQTVHHAILDADGLPAIQQAVTQYLRHSCETAMLAWYSPAGHQIGQPERIDGLLCPAEGISPLLRDQFRTAAVECTRRKEICDFGISPTLRLFAMPVRAYAGHSLLLVAESAPDAEGGCRGVMKSLLLLSTFIGEWATQKASLRNAENASTVAALIELVAHVQSAEDATSAWQRLVDSLQSYLKVERVIVGLCRRGSSEVRVSAISGGEIVDPFASETRLLECALQESLIRSACGVWPVIDAENRHALLSHQQLVDSGVGETVISVPLQTETGDAAGSLLVVLRSDASESDRLTHVREIERFLRAGAGAFAGCLSLLQKLADSRVLQVIQNVRTAFTASRLQLAAWILAAVSLGLMAPVIYCISCAVELQPVQRNYVAAPFEGTLEKCLVEPGDIVVKNQLLAQMDGREIRWELAEVQANLNKATKERNTQLSKKDFGDAAISGHEMQRLEQRAALLSHRNESLEIRSPADGVVVSGDHREAEGVPLEMGKTLFEIAPLSGMVVEICIPEEDIRHVTVGMKVEIQLEAIPEDRVEATIRSIHPRAELRDAKNVFVAEADIPNPIGLLRPGMRGQAQVQTQRHALGWNLFHKPAAWLLGWLGW